MSFFSRISRSIAFKSILVIVFLLTVFTLIISVIGYKATSDSLFDQYTEDAFQVAHAAAFVIDGDEFDEVVKLGSESEEYREIWARLDQLCNAFDATFIYVIKPDLSDYGHITFIYSTVRWDSEYTPYALGYVRETTNDEYRLKYRNLYEGVSDHELLLLNGKEYSRAGHHITAMVPVKDTEQRTRAIICVQRQLDDIRALQNGFISNVIRTLLVLAALEIAGVGAYLSDQLIKPIEKITNEASRFAKENVTAQKKLTDTIRSNDEIGVLAHSIDRMEEQITSYVEHLTTVTAEKERISTELNVAKQIQTEMLPGVFPAFPDRKDFDIYASMTPAKEVGGDFYDFFLIDDDHLAMVMADVSGKGVPAALFMVIAKTLIKNRALMGDSPAEILYNVNNQLCDGNESGMFVTVWLAILELSTGKGVAANAGHEHPVICRKDGKYELAVYRHSMAVAAMENLLFREHSFEMHPGDKLFAYTDGVPEATNTEEELFGTDRMLEALNRNPEASPEELLKEVRKSIDAFVGKAPQFDDFTMLSMYYYGQEKREETDELTLEARNDNLNRVLAFVDEKLNSTTCSAKVLTQIDTAAEELFVNIASYAYAPGVGDVTVRVRLERDPPAAEITFTESGMPFNPLERQDPDTTLPAHARRIGGLGVYMVKKSMDEVRYEYRDGQNILTIRKKL